MNYFHAKIQMDPPPEEFEIAGCEGKVKFESWALAREVTKRRGRHQKIREVYKCPYCHKFHVGSLKRKRFKMRRRIHELGK